MSQSALRPVLRNTALLLGGLGVLAMAWVSLEQILRASPFAKFGLTGTPIGAEVGVTLSDFHMKAYETGRLAAVADVETVEVRRDRSLMELAGVTEGRFFPKEGEPLAFDMKTATYHYFQGQLQAADGAQVKNDELDLESERFVYDEQSKTLVVRGRVQGKLGDGHVKANDFTLNTATQEFSATNVMWVGRIDDPLQPGQRREWNVQGDLQKGSTAKVSIFTNAVATDGEIIVKADWVQRTRDTEELLAKGNVKYFGLDANMLCDEATVYQKERRAVFTGVVRMVVKSEDDEKAVETEFPTIERVDPKTLETDPQGATDEQFEKLRSTENIRKYPIKVIADKIEYWYRQGERRAVITGSPFARQDLESEWRLGKAVEAYYDGETEMLTLKSNSEERLVHVYSSVGDHYAAINIYVSTKEGDDNIHGDKVELTGFVNEDEVPTRTTGGGTGGGGTTGGGSTGR